VTAKTRTSRTAPLEAPALLTDSRWLLANRVAASSCLSRANQLRDILLYSVRQSILSPDEPIRESEIAHRVLGRRSDFNPLDDNIVRVQMAHLRKKLETYFSEDGRDEPVVLAIALGSYKPIFTPRVKPPAEEARLSPEMASSSLPHTSAGQPSNPVAEGNPTSPIPAHLSPAARLLAVVALAAVAAALLLGTVVYRQHRQLNTLRLALAPWRANPTVAAFWSNFFDSPRDTDLILGDDSLLLIEQLTGQYASFNSYLSRSYLAVPSAPATRTALKLIASKGLGSTSEFKLARIIQAEDPTDNRLHLYAARQYLPSLFKQNNEILIGGRVSNPWAGLVDDKLNFAESTQFVDVGITSVANHNPRPGEPNSWLASDAVGYCVIAYLPHPSDGRSVLILEGTNSEATEAAGDFLFDEAQLAAFLHKTGKTSFPPFELLLKIAQVKGTPLTATIEAYRTY
jgi:hypothetical protein